jgi:lysophospholipase L1-like esterase
MSPLKILFLGHSLIEYFDWQTRFPRHEVHNFGVAGETIQGLLSRVPGIVSQFPGADLIFIMTGINNVAMDDSDFITSYRQVIRGAKKGFPQASIFIHSLLPVSFEWISNETIKETNRELCRIAEEEGVSYLDIHELFSDEKGEPKPGLLVEDGIHLSPEGYRLWSVAIERIIIKGRHYLC